MLRLPSSTALACFETSARLGSFTRAAAELHLTQAAVSRQVIGLEQRLGTALFLRARDALRLTDAGQAYLSEVRPALARIERATADVRALQGRGGTLKLSVASSLANHWLIPRLPGFTRAHGEITLNIATRVGPADFTDPQLDASLEFGDGQRAGLVGHFVLPLALRPFAAPVWVRAHGGAKRGLGVHTPAEMLIHQTTLPEGWPGWFARAGLAAPAGLAGPTGPRHDLLSMALNAAMAGLGVALLPDFMVEHALASRRLVALSKVRWTAPRAYWLYTRNTEPLPTPVRTLCDWLLAEARAEVNTVT
jgi:LysR family transcriptional regulator, glycine cleavage system transcriptional activator